MTTRTKIALSSIYPYRESWTLLTKPAIALPP